MDDIPGSKADVPDLIPARMLSEFAYCPRLCYIEWIDGEFVDNEDTVDGRFQHRRVDAEAERISEDEFETLHARSVSLAGSKVGITCRIDLLEKEGKRVTPVEYKRGRAPDIPEGAYEPDRVQLCAQGLVLKDNGFQCDQGVVYFVRSKKRVPVAFNKALQQRTKDLISELRKVADKREIPPPLQDSPKCNRCSLAGICLPDEVNLLQEMEAKGGGEIGGEKGLVGKIRKLLPARDDTLPVYVVGHGHMVRKKGDLLEIWSAGKDAAEKDDAKREKDGTKKGKHGREYRDGRDGRVSEVRLREISQLNLYGGVEITTPALADLMQRSIPVLHFTRGGWFKGISTGHTHKNVELRMKQFEWATDRKKSLTIARCLVYGKIKNCRTQVRRNDPTPPAKVLERLDSSPMMQRRLRILRSSLESRAQQRRYILAAWTAF